jgi:hypothetical protein
MHTLFPVRGMSVQKLRYTSTYLKKLKYNELYFDTLILKDVKFRGVHTNLEST